MENTTISITLHILLNPQILSSQQTNENGIDMSLRINSNTLITNISHTIMSEIGLQQLTSYHEAYIQVPPANNFIHSSSFPDKTINIATLEAWIHDTPKIKVLITGIEGITDNEFNLMQFYNINYTFLQNNMINTIFNSTIEKINNLAILSYLLSNMDYTNNSYLTNENAILNEENGFINPLKLPNIEGTLMEAKKLEQACLPNDTHLSNNANVLFDSQECKGTHNTNNDVISEESIEDDSVDKIPKIRRKVKFDPKNELPILEYLLRTTKFPKTCKLKELANYFNLISNLTGGLRKKGLCYCKMECIIVNLIIEPILGSRTIPAGTIFQEYIQMTVTINSSTMIKDACYVLMRRIGLEHLVNSSEAFIKCPRNNCFTSIYCFPNPTASVGNLETWNREYLTVKISVKGNIQDFSGFEGRNSIYRNLLFLLLKKYPFIANEETNPVVREAIKRIEDNSLLFLKHTSLLSINEVLERELSFVTRNIPRTCPPIHSFNKNCKTGNSPSPRSVESTIDCNFESGNVSTPSVHSLTAPATLEYENGYNSVAQSIDESSPVRNFDNNNRIISKTVLKRTPRSQPRVKFDPKTETPILKEWYKITKIPSSNQLKQFADHLNQTSNRTVIEELRKNVSELIYNIIIIQTLMILLNNNF
uniref:HTH OST-type domain-containing protein n=1 Tax=Strongyloides stercoralis TaxID=6248 RepID=A0A0K0DZM0_STRER